MGVEVIVQRDDDGVPSAIETYAEAYDFEERSLLLYVLGPPDGTDGHQRVLAVYAIERWDTAKLV